jgi:hypothetical protein
MTDPDPKRAPAVPLTPPGVIPSGTRERPRANLPDYISRTVRVYAAGSVHGPTYDAHGHRITQPAPEVVGFLTPDGKLERLEGRHRAA